MSNALSILLAVCVSFGMLLFHFLVSPLSLDAVLTITSVLLVSLAYALNYLPLYESIGRWQLLSMVMVTCWGIRLVYNNALLPLLNVGSWLLVYNSLPSPSEVDDDE